MEHIALAETKLTLEEFQKFAETHDGYWELYEGVPVRMDSPGAAHQWIAKRLLIAIDSYLAGKKCEVLPEMDVWVSSEKLDSARNKKKDATRRPDLLVYCGKEQHVSGVILAPQLVAEIWSPSNTAAERAEKQAVYQSIGVGEIWQIDAETGDFCILTFENKFRTYFSGGNIRTEPLKSQYFPGLWVDLSGIDGFLEAF